MKTPTSQSTSDKQFFAAVSYTLKKRKDTVKLISEGFLYAATALLLGSCTLPFGASPLGVAFLCAANKRIPYILAGLSLSALFSDKPLIMIAVYVAVLLLRVLVRLTLDPPFDNDQSSGELTVAELLPSLFSENVTLRMATSCVGVFAISLYTLIGGGFLFYDLFGAILSMLISPLFILATYPHFCDHQTHKAYKYLSLATFGFFIVFSARELSVYGLSLAAFGALLLTLLATRKKGPIFGMCTGAVLGLAYSPLLSPAFILTAVCSGALFKVSSLLAASASFAIGSAFALYAKGISAVTDFLPAMLSACLLFAVIDKLFLCKDEKKPLVKKAEKEENEEKEEKTEISIPREGTVLATSELLTERLSASITRQRTLSDTFGKMSEFFSELGEKMRAPLYYDTKNICDSAFDSACVGCRYRDICHTEKRAETLAAINTVSSALHRLGSISKSDVPDCLCSVCERLPDILDEINHNYSMHLRELLLCDKTEIFATDYRAMSEMLRVATQLECTEFKADRELSARLCDVLSQNKLGISSSIVFGNKRRRVILTADNEEFLKEKQNELLPIVERALGKTLTIEGIEKRACGAVMYLCERKRFSAEHATKSVTSAFEKEFCGDSARIFESGDGTLYSLISDGMGAGRDAALTSGICAMFLKKMLLSSASCETSLKMLNVFLRNKGGGSIHECSATVDLCELDLVLGKASIYKSGAAPSFLLRDGKLYKLRSNTLPLGIIKELDTKRLSFDIKEGDVIVMASDGVTAGSDECPWLSDTLKDNLDQRSLKSCAELIAERAKKENESDDITVTVIKIENNI